MNPKIEDELRAGLRAYTRDVTASPVLAAAVRRRQRRRTRLTLVAVPVAVAVLLVAGTGVLPRGGAPGPAPVPAAADEALLTRPTEGDLAGRADYLDAMVRVFLEGVRPRTAFGSVPAAPAGTERVGEPHVLWAGMTPAGNPSGVVVQKERTPTGTVIAIGYVGGGPYLAAVSRGGDLAGVFLSGQELLVVDRGEPLAWSYRHTYEPGGGIRLIETPVRFRDGVAVLTVPEGVDAGSVELVRPGGPPGTSRLLRLGNDPGTGPAGVRLAWGGGRDGFGESLWPVAGADRWPDPGPATREDYTPRRDQLRAAFHGPVDALPTDLPVTGWAEDLWYAYGATPDGRRLVATDLAAAGDPSRAYVVLTDDAGRSTVTAGGPIGRGDSVPVRVRLPDGQGWLVAAKGSALSWRTGTGPWTTAGTDAALLPATATEVRADTDPATPLR
jgi:hypothetical protein